MPTYEYRCQDCGHHFDVLYRSISAAQEAAQPRCPKCGSADSQRVLSAFTVASGVSTVDSRATGDPAPGSAPAGITSRTQIDSWRASKARSQQT